MHWLGDRSPLEGKTHHFPADAVAKGLPGLLTPPTPFQSQRQSSIHSQVDVALAVFVGAVCANLMPMPD